MKWRRRPNMYVIITKAAPQNESIEVIPTSHMVPSSSVTPIIPLSGILWALLLTVKQDTVKTSNQFSWASSPGLERSVNHLRPVSHASSSTDADACRDGTVAAASSVERVVEP